MSSRGPEAEYSDVPLWSAGGVPQVVVAPRVGAARHVRVPERAFDWAESRPRSPLLVVEGLEEAPPDDITTRRADPLAVASALRRGLPVERIFTWDGTAVRVEATPEMVPPGASVHEVGSAGDTPEEVSGFRYVRLRPVMGTPSDNSGAEEAGAHLERMVLAHPHTPFKVAVVAQGIPSDEIGTLARAAATRISNAERSKLDPTATVAQARATEELEVIEAGRTAGLARETIVIGADPRDLEEVARTAEAVFSSQRPVTYVVERGLDGALLDFSDIASAASTATGGGRLLVTGGDLARRAVLPEEAMVGLGRISPPTNFDLDYTIPAGIPRITFAERLNNRGRRIGRPMQMPKEHTAIIAETRAGKTALLRAIGVDIQRQNHERRTSALARGETTYDHEAIVYIDCKKGNNFTHILSRQIAGARTPSGQPIPEDMATVHHFTPGGDGPGVRFNLLRAVGQTPKEWRKRIDTAVEVLSSKYAQKGAETYEAVKKHLTHTLHLAMRTCGINPVTGKSKFPYAMPPHGKPAMPTGEFVIGLVEQAADELEFKGRYRDEVVGWVKGELGPLFMGNNGAPLSADGYDLDAMAVLDNQGVTSMDLVEIRDPGARKVAVLAALYDLYDACVEKNLREGIVGETSKTRVTVVIDEADIFENDQLGAALADFFTHAGSVGLRIVFAKQGGLEKSTHERVLINTPNKIMLRTGHEPDMATFAAGAGRTTLQDMKHLAGAHKGMGVYMGQGMERAARFLVPNPDDPEETPMGARSYVVGPEALIDTSNTVDIFTHDQMAEARDFLGGDPLGLEIRNWAEAAATYIASGRPLPDIGGELAATLRLLMKDPTQRAKLRCAITQAVVASIDSRPELQYVAPRASYIQHNLPHMLAIADGKYLPGWNEYHPELALTVGRRNKDYSPEADGENGWKQFDVIVDGRFAQAKDRLNDQMTAMPHAETAAFEAALGVKLYGDSADEQRDIVIGYRIETVKRIGEVVKAVADGQSLSQDGYQLLVDDVARLVGGQITSSSDQSEIRAQARDIIATHVGQLREIRLRPNEVSAAVSAILQEVPAADLTRSIGITTVEQRLSDAIEARRTTAAALSPQEIAKLCGFDLENMTDVQRALVASTRAIDQFNIIERQLEQEYIAESPYASRVEVNRVFFAFDPLSSGATLNNTIAALQGLQTERGPLYTASLIGSIASATVEHTIGAQIAANNFNAWKKELSRWYAYSDSIVPATLAARRFMVRSLTRVADEVWTETTKGKARATA